MSDVSDYERGRMAAMREYTARQWTVADALNNAIAAIYSNVGPSAPLVDIRRAMHMLGINEDARAQLWANRGSGLLPDAVGQEVDSSH